MLEKISPADTLRRIAKNLDEAKPEYEGLFNADGVGFNQLISVENVMQEAYNKKPTRTITVELPMPLTVEPEEGDRVWVVDLGLMEDEQLQAYEIHYNCGNKAHRSFFKGGLIYTTEHDAMATREELNSKFSIDNIVEGE